MNEAVNAVFDLDEGTEIGEVSDASMNARADLIALVQRLPGILLHLLHAETDATRPRIDTQHLNVDQVAGIDYLARVLHTFGPAHLRDVHEAFNARFELDKSTVVSDARDTSANTRADWKTFLDAGPWIG